MEGRGSRETEGKERREEGMRGRSRKEGKSKMRRRNGKWKRRRRNI